jgi:hypothetical protein
MRPFRHPLLSRLLALLLLAGFGGWVGAPLAAAHPEAKAAQLARVHAAGPVEAAVAEALAAAARADDAPAAFSEALQAALAAQPDGGPLAAYLAEAGSLDALLDLLVGQLLRSMSTPTPLWAAAPASALAASASGPRDAVATSSPDAARTAEPAALASLPARPPALGQAEGPTAQPRGP